MTSSSPPLYDVVIAGGGLAGLTLGLQLLKNFPDMRVAILEKSTRPLPDAAHKVGESSVEIGSYYLGQMLGLDAHLRERHLIKYGLRFFPGGGHLPINERRELGPSREPLVPSYQLDRGRFENELRGFFEEAGGTLLEGVAVREVTLSKDDSPHLTHYAPADDEDAPAETLQSRWFFDATGRVALLRRELKLTRRSTHRANSSWFRVKGRVDITQFAPEEDRIWHDNEWAEHRWRSTNHLMGRGYWLWLIPLSTGHTSIGLVVHDHIHGFQKIQNLQKLRSFIEEHEPHVFAQIKELEVIDFRAIRNYSHNIARSFSPQRWGMVGEAGAFVDPLYSPGTDFITYANTFATELVRTDREGGDLDLRAREFNIQYRVFVAGSLGLYENAADVYGHADAMYLKLYWDNFWYWSFPCQYIFQEIYRETGENFNRFANSGQRMIELSNYLQALTAAWAAQAPSTHEPGFGQMPGFPSRALDAHVALQQKMSFDETLEYIAMRTGHGEEFIGEALVRVLFTVGDAHARALAETLKIDRWSLSIPRARVELERSTGLARRRRLSAAAMDLERSLGRHPQNSSVDLVLELLAPLLHDGPIDPPKDAAPIPTPSTTAAHDTPPTPATPAVDDSPEALRLQMLQMLGGKWVSATVGAAAQLGIPLALRDDAFDAPTIAHWLGAQAKPMERLLLALSSLGVLEQRPDERFGLTALGRTLLPEELGDLATYISSPFSWEPWARLADSVRTGVSSFEIRHGRTLSKHLAEQVDDAKIYDLGVNAFTREEASALIDQIDLDNYKTVLDLGGGHGNLLLELIEAAPHLQGVLFDLPEVIERTQAREAFDGYRERVAFVGGSFQEPIEARGDLVILKHILHNWGDDDARSILRNARETLDGPDARLLVIEAFVLPANHPNTTRMMDMEMLALFDNARERSKPEFRRMLRDSGLRFEASGSLGLTANWILCSRRDA